MFLRMEEKQPLVNSIVSINFNVLFSYLIFGSNSLTSKPISFSILIWQLVQLLFMHSLNLNRSCYTPIA